MKNKKGFTLIELLAVIIILGVLMLIAIPSVTEYISSSRKSAYVSTAQSYITAVRNQVNLGEDFKFYDQNVFYLVQVGHDKRYSRVALEKGGASPFNDTWNYAYVGVTYSGIGYSYYFMSQDASGQGIRLTSADDLAKNGKSLVQTEVENFSFLYSGIGVYEYSLVYTPIPKNSVLDLNPTPMATYTPSPAPEQLGNLIREVTGRQYSYLYVYNVTCDQCNCCTSVS